MPYEGENKTVAQTSGLKQRQALASALFYLILAFHCVLVGYSSHQHAPTIDETGNLVAGLVWWHSGSLDFSPHNPPLMRIVASLPVYVSEHDIDWRYRGHPFDRPELILGRQFVVRNGKDSFRMFTIARWACLPFSLLGGWICWRWAGDHGGPSAAIMALALWCFSPSVLGLSRMVVPDLGASAIGLASFYCLWRWLIQPSSVGAILLTGLLVGLAALAKATWFMLAIAMIPIWIAKLYLYRDWTSARRAISEGIGLFSIFLVAIITINAGCGFGDSMMPLSEHTFYSESLSGHVFPRAVKTEGGNRFRQSWFAKLPVPLPKSYVSGIDLQKREFELGYRSYLRGEWKHGGWWYYYIYALMIKVPLGTWALLLMGLLYRTRGRANRLQCLEDIGLTTPAFLLLFLVSSQTGFNHHFRYVMPVLPFAYVWISKSLSRCVAPSFCCLKWCLLFLAVAGSLAVYPHSASYFNLLVGGSHYGHKHLVDGNLGCGDDLFFLKHWLDEHPSVRPLGLVHFSSVDPQLAGIDFFVPSRGPSAPGQSCSRPAVETGPKPGWYAVDASFVQGMHRRIADGNGGWSAGHSAECEYGYFKYFEPVAKAGYSIFIYHLELNETNRVRRQLGLPSLGPE